MERIDKDKAVLGAVMVIAFYVVQSILSGAISLLAYPFYRLGIIYTIVRALLDIITIAASFVSAYTLLAKFLLKKNNVPQKDLIEMGVVVGLVSEAFYRFLAMFSIYGFISMFFCLVAVFAGTYFLAPIQVEDVL